MAMEFTTDWFVPHIATWNSIVPTYQPSRYLEIGSFEGRSTCHFIQMMGQHHALDIHCLDTWEGGEEHQGLNMRSVEDRFDANIRAAASTVGQAVNLRKIKGRSHDGLVRLLAEGRRDYFDVAYIDGSHQAPDVLLDAALTFPLVRVGGLIIFDDYVWGLGANADPLHTPKLAIDSFLNCFQRKVQPHAWAPLCQLYCRKLSN